MVRGEEPPWGARKEKRKKGKKRPFKTRTTARPNRGSRGGIPYSRTCAGFVFGFGSAYYYLPELGVLGNPFSIPGGGGERGWARKKKKKKEKKGKGIEGKLSSECLV